MMNDGFVLCDNCKSGLKNRMVAVHSREGWHDPKKKLPVEGQLVRFEYLLPEKLGRSFNPQAWVGEFKDGKFQAIVYRRRNAVFTGDYSQFDERPKGYVKQILRKAPSLIYRWI